MKVLLLLLLVASCTQKYSGYELIRKVDFNQRSYERPLSVYEVTPKGKDKIEQCFNQFLFFSNANKEVEESLPLIVRTLCPNNSYLLNSDFTETWWTTIFFTRSCIEVTSTCADERRK